MYHARIHLMFVDKIGMVVAAVATQAVHANSQHNFIIDDLMLQVKWLHAFLWYSAYVIMVFLIQIKIKPFKIIIVLVVW